ncbi:MAG: hypothetical protein AAFY72_05920 [Cyanobacteria bacterium J06649_4]
MKKISSLARFGVLAAALSGAVLISSIQKAQANPQTFSASGVVPSNCTFSNEVNGTMAYDATGGKLTTDTSGSANGTRPSFTVDCNGSAATTIGYSIDATVPAAFTALGGNRLCEVSLHDTTDGSAQVFIVDQTTNGDCEASGSAPTASLNGTTGTDGEIKVEVGDNNPIPNLPAGIYTYNITLTWTP